jgi:predicted Zn-dependent peptidase
MKTLVIGSSSVILDEKPDSQLVHIILLSKIGSRYENKPGITHFLEHTIFKGSRHFKEEEIGEFFETYGSSIDAFTTKESLVIYTTVLSHKLYEALEIISDMIFHPKFDENEIENEKNIIIQEYKEILDNYEELAYIYLYKAIFGDHPLSREIIGYPKEIKTFTREDVILRKDEVFSKNNIIIGIFGHFDSEKLLTFLEKNFLFFKDFKPNKHPFSSYKPTLIKKTKKTKSSYIYLGIPILNYKKLKRGLYFLSFVLGYGSSSILFKEIREKLGLVYDISTFLDFYKDISVFGIDFSVDINKLEKVLSRIKSILKSFEINSDLVEKVKKKIITSMIIEFENYQNYLFSVVNEYLYDEKLLVFEDFLKNWTYLGVDEVMEAFELISNIDNYSISIVGNA